MKPTAAFCLALFVLPAGLAAGEFGCPHCRTSDKTCTVKVTQADEKETCYEVECEEVCIPAVRFPWESCRTPKCGRVVRVARLKKESRETKVCEYEWQIACPRCGRCAASAGKPAETCDPTVPPAPAEVPMPPAAPAAETTVLPQPAGMAVAARLSQPFARRSAANGRSRTR